MGWQASEGLDRAGRPLRPRVPARARKDAPAQPDDDAEPLGPDAPLRRRAPAPRSTGAGCEMDGDTREGAELVGGRVMMSIDGGVAEVRLARPDKLNALDLPMLKALVDTGERLKGERSVRAVVLSGEGRGFCAGLDIGTLQTIFEAGGDDHPAEGALSQIGATDGRITHLAQQSAHVWSELECPVIAAVHGAVFGGGLQIALSADIRIASPDAQLSVLEIRWGIVPDMTGTLTLPELVGLDVAKLLAFTGRTVSAEEAARIGLVTQIDASPRDAALALARELVHRNPHALRGIKRLLDGAGRSSPAQQFAAERETIRPLLGSRNQLEAVVAQLEDRDPDFDD